MDIQKGTYTYTGSGGQKHHVPIERVHSFSQLHKEDHIAFERRKGLYWHHAIVEHVETDKDTINVIEYSNSAKGFSQDNSSPPKNPGKAKVRRHEYSESKDALYLIKHKNVERADILTRARSKLGEKKYSIFTNNCEHFAMWCKKEISSSEQVENLKEKTKKAAKESGKHLVVELVVETGEKIVMKVRAPLNSAKKEALRVLHSLSIDAQDMLFNGAQTGAMQGFTQYLAKGGQIMLQYGAQMALGLCFPSSSKCGQAMMLNGGEIALEQLLFQSISKGVNWSVERVAQIAAERVTQALSKGGQWVLKKVAQMAAEPVATQTSTTTRTFAGRSLLGGAAFGALIEGAIGLYDIYWVNEDLKVGKISEKEFYDAIGERFLVGVGGVIGATAGAAVGQLIPLPVVVGIVGSVLGELVGQLGGERFLVGVGGVIGATAGAAVAKLVPFPVVGGIVGSVLGGLVGRLSGERFLVGVGVVIGATAGAAVAKLISFPVVGGIVVSVFGGLVGRLGGNLAWNAKKMLGL